MDALVAEDVEAAARLRQLVAARAEWNRAVLRVGLQSTTV